MCIATTSLNWVVEGGPESMVNHISCSVVMRAKLSPSCSHVNTAPRLCYTLCRKQVEVNTQLLSEETCLRGTKLWSFWQLKPGLQKNIDLSWKEAGYVYLGIWHVLKHIYPYTFIWIQKFTFGTVLKKFCFPCSVSPIRIFPSFPVACFMGLAEVFP